MLIILLLGQMLHSARQMFNWAAFTAGRGLGRGLAVGRSFSQGGLAFFLFAERGDDPELVAVRDEGGGPMSSTSQAPFS